MREIMKMSNICKTYLKGEAQVQALDKFSLTVYEGDFLAIVGSSGSGKSTLMNIIGCLDKPDSGEYLLDDENTALMTSKQQDEIRSDKIGFIFQKFCLIPTLDADENVQLPLYYKKLPAQKRKELAAEALKTVGLSDRMHHRPNELSGGQQQRVAIARAIVTNPKVILADEPTGNLDSASGKAIIELLERLHFCGKTIVMITHDEKVAKRAKRRVELCDGKIIKMD